MCFWQALIRNLSLDQNLTVHSLSGILILLIKYDFRTESLMILFGAHVFGLQEQDLILSPMMKENSLVSKTVAEENFKILILRYSVNTLKTHANKCSQFFLLLPSS